MNIKMIVKDEFLSRIRKIFKLNLYEAKVWTALLSRGVSTAGELSDISGVPRSRTYDILESLEKKGFIVMKMGKPIKFVALKPAEVIERVKRRVVMEAKEMNKRLDSLKGTDVLKELEQLYVQGIKYVEPTDLTGAIRGRTNLYNHLDMIFRNAKKEIVLMTTNSGLVRKYESLKNTIEKLKKKGVKVKIAAPIDENNIKVARELAKIADVRHTNLNARFALADNKEALLMVMNDSEIHPNYDVGVWVNSPFLVKALKHFIDKHWNAFTPVTKIKL